MVRKPDIQYVDDFYVHGSEARVLELKTGRRHPKTTLPKPVKEKKIRIAVDPVAIGGIVVAVAMLALMLLAVADFSRVCRTHQIMEQYVIQLQNENVELKQDYARSYDIAKVEETALAIGMKPAGDAASVSLKVTVPEPEQEPGWIENMVWFLKGLFA